MIWFHGSEEKLVCPRCGSEDKLALVDETVMPAESDEHSAMFYKCGNCGYVGAFARIVRDPLGEFGDHVDGPDALRDAT